MGRKSKWNVDHIQEFLDSTDSGCTLVTKEIRYLKDKLEFKCKCGNHFYRNFHNVVNQKSYYCEDCFRKIMADNQRFTHDDYLQKLKEKNITKIIPIEKYVDSKTNIQHKCLVCNHEWSARPHNILSGFGCPQCALNNRTIVGVNDMWTTAPELAKCLENPEDGYKYPKSSKERVNFICPDCGSLLKDRVIHHTYFNGGLKCPYCSDGMSVPNKFMSQILQYCNVDYEPEYIFDWAKDKRYDFYLPNHNAILEIMGGQHYQENNFASKQGRTLEEEQDNDAIKLDLAKNNGVIYYYQIDFRYSDFEYMRNKLIDSELFSLLKIDINTIDFESCYKASLKSRVFEAVDYWNKGLKVNDIYPLMKVSNATVISYLNQANKLGLCDYEGFNNRLKPVRCITTNKIFESLKSAQEYYSVKYSYIRECCNGIREYAGVDEDGNKLIWEFISKSDYRKMVALLN